MGGFLGDKALELFKEAMEDYGIQPGELYQSIDETLQIINKLAPQVERMEDISSNLDEDVGELHDEIKRFNDNTEDLVDALEDNSETLNKLADLVEDVEEVDQE